MKSDEDKAKAYTFDFNGKFLLINPIPSNKLPSTTGLDYLVKDPEALDTGKKKRKTK